MAVLWRLHSKDKYSQFSSEWSEQSTCPLQNFSTGWHESWSRHGLLPTGQPWSKLQWVAFIRMWSWLHLHVRPPEVARQKCWQLPLFSVHWLEPVERSGLSISWSSWCSNLAPDDREPSRWVTPSYIKTNKKLPFYAWGILMCGSYIPDWLDLLNAFMLTTCVPTSNHNLLCCCSSLYQSLVLSVRKSKHHEKFTGKNKI